MSRLHCDWLQLQAGWQALFSVLRTYSVGSVGTGGAHETWQKTASTATDGQ